MSRCWKTPTTSPCPLSRSAEGSSVQAGVYFRLGLGGITGHHDFARPTGVIVPPSEAVRVCNAVVRAYIAHGDRTDRNKARLKYVLDRNRSAGFPGGC